MRREPTEYVLVAGTQGHRATRLTREDVESWRCGRLGLFMRRSGVLLELMNAGEDEYSEWRPVTAAA